MTIYQAQRNISYSRPHHLPFASHSRMYMLYIKYRLKTHSLIRYWHQDIRTGCSPIVVCVRSQPAVSGELDMKWAEAIIRFSMTITTDSSVCVCVCVCACMRACVCVGRCATLRSLEQVHARNAEFHSCVSINC